MTLLDRYAQAWADGSAPALAACWDPPAFRFYKAEEVAHAFTGWDAVLDYWRDNVVNHEAVRLEFGAPERIPLDAGWTMLWFTMRWDIRFKAGPLGGKAMGGDNHVLALTRGDRLTGWSETPDAPISYMRRLYEAQARI